MRTLVLVLLFMIWESSADGPAARVDPPTGAMLLMIGYCVLIAVVRLWAIRVARLADPRKFARRINRFNFGMDVARGLVPAWFAVGVFALGWRQSVDHALVQVLGHWAVDPLVTPGVLVGLLPGFFGWTGLWWSQYPVDRSAREQSALAQLEAALPVFAPSPFGSYFANKLRVQLLFTTVPVVLILILRDATNVGLRAAARSGRLHATWPPSPTVDASIDFATVAFVLLVIPALLRHVLNTRRLPEGRLRDGLGEVLRMAGVRCREVLLWDTHNNLGNAAVMGVIPAVRYVMLSDLLLETMTDEQVQAVFAHELGHVHHRHLTWFAAVLGSGLAALYVVSDWVMAHAHPRSMAAAVAWECGSGVATVTVMILGFGLLSRWFERQADVYAVRLMSRLGPHGDVAFTSALRRVAAVNNIPLRARNWTHGSMANRVAYIARLTADPAVGRRFDRKGRRVRMGLYLLIAVCAMVVARSIYIAAH